MALEALYACKLFRNSSRKSQIYAAIQDPMNSELVMQLSENLSDDSLNMLSDMEEDIDSKDSDRNEADKAQKSTRSNDKDKKDSKQSGGVIHRKSSNNTANSKSTSSEKDDDKSLDEKYELSNKLAEETDDEDKVSEAVNITKSGISGCVTTPSLSYVADEIDSIKGLLNLSDDTKGVVRMQVKSEELWIYYADNISLNTVMESVIYRINSSGYTMLEFNRLARTVNAIVFTILRNSSPILPKSEISTEENSDD